MEFSYTALFFIGLVALAQCFNEEELEVIKELSDSCIEQTGVSTEQLIKAEGGDFASDTNFKEYLFCMVKTPGFMNDAGDYQVEVMRGMLEQKSGADVAKEIIEECTKFEGDKLDKAFQFSKCMHSKRT